MQLNLLDVCFRFDFLETKNNCGDNILNPDFTAGSYVELS